MKKISLLIIAIFMVIGTRAGEVLTIKDRTAEQFAANMRPGINLGNTLDALNTGPNNARKRYSSFVDDETYWGLKAASQADFDLFKKLGYKTVRIPVTWFENTYYDTNKHLRVFDGWKNRVKAVVDMALKDGLQVVINIHHEQPMVYLGNKNGDQDVPQVYNDFRDLWAEIAYTFRNYDENLAFEACNEVAPKQGWGDVYKTDRVYMMMNHLNQIFVNTVRATGGNNTKRVLIVPTIIDGTGDTDFKKFILPYDNAENRLMVQVHDYDHAMAEAIDASFERMEKFSRSINAPIMIGEFGTTPETGGDGVFKPGVYRPYHISNFVARFIKHGMCGTYWCDGNPYNFGVVYRRKESVQGSYNEEMVKAMVNPQAYKFKHSTIYNNPSDYTFELLWGNSGKTAPINGWSGVVLGHTPIAIQNGAKYMSVSSSTAGDFSTVTTQYVVFYDANKNYISYQKNNGTFDIPDGAKYFAISMNSASWGSWTFENFITALQNNDVSLIVSYLGTNPTDWLTTVN